MSVDYEGVGGIGIEFTDEMALLASKAGIFSEEDWEENEDLCLYDIGIGYKKAGNDYIGETKWYLFVDGETFEEVTNNIPKFMRKLSDCGISIEYKDLKVIEDIYIY